MQHGATPEADFESLDPAQLRALAALLEGKNRTAVAEAVGVRRETLWRWFHSDQRFQRVWARLRVDQADDLRSEVNALATDGITALRSLLSDTTPPEVRLRAVGLLFKSLEFVDAPKSKTPPTTGMSGVQSFRDALHGAEPRPRITIPDRDDRWPCEETEKEDAPEDDGRIVIQSDVA